MSLDIQDINNSNDLNNGVEMIISAFNEQKKQYLKIIDSLQEKISSLESTIEKLQKDNMKYQKKLHALQSNIKCISNTICQLGNDEEEFLNVQYFLNKKPNKGNFHKKYSYNKINSNPTRVANSTINNTKKISDYLNKIKNYNINLDNSRIYEDEDIKISNNVKRKNYKIREKISNYKKPIINPNNLINNKNTEDE